MYKLSRHIRADLRRPKLVVGRSTRKSCAVLFPEGGGVLVEQGGFKADEEVRASGSLEGMCLPHI